MVSESLPPPERAGSPDERRDQLLLSMWLQGWANKSSGDLACPTTGRFARISNVHPEIVEIMSAFQAELLMFNVNPTEILGHFLVRMSFEDIDVIKWDNEEQLDAAYNLLEAQYQYWLDQPPSA